MVEECLGLSLTNQEEIQEFDNQSQSPVAYRIDRGESRMHSASHPMLSIADLALRILARLLQRRQEAPELDPILG